MKVAILALAPCGHALGGEDQAASFLRRAFARKGWDAAVFFEHEAVSAKGEWDLVLSYGAFCPAPSSPAVFWHFNERISLIDCAHLRRLGYTHLATNQPEQYRCQAANAAVAAHFGHALYLPLAADRSQLGMPDCHGPFECEVCYVGNWNGYKGKKVERYLEPFVHLGLRIYGGPRWMEHPTLSQCWAGVLPPESWPSLGKIARVQLAFRSPAQAVLGMIPDRLFGLLASGAPRILSDGPPGTELMGRVNWLCDEDMALYAHQYNGHPPIPSNIIEVEDGPSFISTYHLFDHRVDAILREVGHAGS